MKCLSYSSVGRDSGFDAQKTTNMGPRLTGVWGGGVARDSISTTKRMLFSRGLNVVLIKVQLLYKLLQYTIMPRTV